MAIDRTSRLSARHTDSSSSTMTISGLELLNDVGLHTTIETISKKSTAIALNGLTLAKGKTGVYWTLVQYGEDGEKAFGFY
jgi:hypothetical protein